MTQPLAPGGAERAATVAPPADFLDGFISEEEYAARRGVSLRTCQRDRQLRQSPPFVVIGRRVYWDVDGVEIRVILDFGAGFIDHRGWFMNAGA
ncbi:MAG: hypothetical protein ACOCYW_09965 [Roseicyclus sp.]